MGLKSDREYVIAFDVATEGSVATPFTAPQRSGDGPRGDSTVDGDVLCPGGSGDLQP